MAGPIAAQQAQRGPTPARQHDVSTPGPHLQHAWVSLISELVFWPFPGLPSANMAIGCA